MGMRPRTIRRKMLSGDWSGRWPPPPPMGYLRRDVDSTLTLPADDSPPTNCPWPDHDSSACAPRAGVSTVIGGDAYDVVIENGRVVDGTGAAWYYGDLAIRGDRI